MEEDAMSDPGQQQDAAREEREKSKEPMGRQAISQPRIIFRMARGGLWNPSES
jgi:hypothetical protein